jgi:phosphonate transport system substrate-binding protein
MNSGSLVAYAVVASIALAATATAQECKDPEALRFLMIPTEETTQELSLYQPLVNNLKEAPGKKIEFYLPTSYASVIEAMLSGWVDIGMFGPESYVIAHEKEPTIEVFATYSKKKGHFQEEGPGYMAVLVARADSKFDNIDSIKGSVVGLTDPASTSGNLLPRALFVDEIGGQDLEAYFSRVVYTGGHDLSAVAVLEKQVDSAFVATHRLDNVIDRDLAKVEDYRVLWTSPLVPLDPFALSTHLCPELQEKIKIAFLSLDQNEEGRKYLENVNATKFVAMKDSDYDFIRKLGAK